MNRSNSPSRKLRNVSLAGGVCLATLMAVVPAASAVAQDAASEEGKAAVRYQRKSSKVATKNTLDTKFKEQKQASDAAQKKKVEMMSAEDFARKKSAVAREVADKQIEMMKRLIQSTEKGEAEYPDLLFRLADHYLEKKAYFELQSGTLYDQIYAAEEKKNMGLANQLKTRQKKFEQDSKAASDMAVKVYKVMVSDAAFSKYKRMDEALYFYAFELGQLGREAEMTEAYLRLIKEYPNSTYIPNAYLSFADYYYGRGQVGEALKLYEKVITFKDSPVYAFALYKMGWCYLNPIGTGEPQYEQSLQKFVQTIEATLQGRAGSEANAKQLRRDARRDLIKAYVHSGKPSRAWEFFQKVGNGPKPEEDMARQMMELLAVAYFGDGMYVESTSVYKKLQEMHAQDPLVCEWQGRIVVNALATDDKQIQWRETARLGEYWSQFRDGNFKAPIKRKCRDEALDTMKQMATVWHDEAAKTKRPETYELAEQAYQAFLQTFPKDKDSYELQFYYADLVWARAALLTENKATYQASLPKWRKAHDEFLKVLEMNPKGKYTVEAARAQMLAMKNHLEYDETGGKSKACKTNSEGVCIYKLEKKKKPKKGKEAGPVDALADYPETEYTEAEKGMITAYDVYQKYVTDAKDKELPKIMYHRALLMQTHNKFGDARPLIEEILKKFDGTLYAAWCSEMLLDMLTIRWLDKGNSPEQTVKASNELEEWSNKLMKMQVYKHPEADELREAIPRLLAGIGWKRGTAYKDAGAAGDLEGFVKCAEEFLTVYNNHPNHDKADTLLWNAAICYEAAWQLGQAVRMRNILLEKYPTSQHSKDALYQLGGNYQRVAMFGKAADRFEQYSEKYKGDKEAPHALQNAYLFRLGLGEKDKAAQDIVKYEDLYKKKDPKEAARIFWSRNELEATDAERMAHAQEYLKLYGKTGGTDRRVVAEAMIGQILWRQSCSKALLYDSCMAIQRSKATAGEDRRKKYREAKKKAAKKKDKQEIPKYCGSATQGIITVFERDKKRAAQAQQYFDSVLRAVSTKVDVPESDTQRVQNFKDAWGKAVVYRSDQKYEEYLRINLPEGMDFTVEEWKKDAGLKKWENEYKQQVKTKEESDKKFKAFLEKKGGLLKDLHAGYDSSIKTKSFGWMIAGAARSAMVSQNFADQLFRAEVPKSFKTEDQAYAYCDALGDAAEPYQQDAVAKFTICLEKSTEYQWFNEFSRLCEDELQQTNAEKYPSTNELFGQSIYTSSSLDSVNVQVDLEGDRKRFDKKPPPKKEEGEKKEGEATKEGAEAEAPQGDAAAEPESPSAP